MLFFRLIFYLKTKNCNLSTNNYQIYIKNTYVKNNFVNNYSAEEHITL